MLTSQVVRRGRRCPLEEVREREQEAWRYGYHRLLAPSYVPQHGNLTVAYSAAPTKGSSPCVDLFQLQAIMLMTAAREPATTCKLFALGVTDDSYDIWDLGEFEQKGAKGTKWGTKEELVKAIDVASDNGIITYIDAVMNHKYVNLICTGLRWLISAKGRSRRQGRVSGHHGRSGKQEQDCRRDAQHPRLDQVSEQRPCK